MYAIFGLEERISPAPVHNITFFEAVGRENSFDHEIAISLLTALQPS
jgi:hypothetical protein